MTKKTKRIRPSPIKPEYVSPSEIFPWLRKESNADYEKRMKLREKNMKKHPRLKAHAYGTDWEYTEKIKTFDEDVILKDPLLFIDVNEADTKQKKALKKWLTGQTCPKIPGVEWACYPSDYGRFYEAFVEGKIATVTD
jgi:hypothetical protein